MVRLFRKFQGILTFIGILLMVVLAYVALQVFLFVGPVVFVAWILFKSIWTEKPED